MLVQHSQPCMKIPSYWLRKPYSEILLSLCSTANHGTILLQESCKGRAEIPLSTHKFFPICCNLRRIIRSQLWVFWTQIIVCLSDFLSVYVSSYIANMINFTTPYCVWYMVGSVLWLVVCSVSSLYNFNWILLVKFYMNIFIKRKSISKCLLQNGNHFVEALVV